MSSINDYAGSVKEAFRNSAKDKLFVCHFDGKQLEEFTDGVKTTKERMSVMVSSPSLDHAQVLGALSLDGHMEITSSLVFCLCWRILE